jgi:hypothetical protein
MKAILKSALSIFAGLLLASNANALTCYALTSVNHLVRFDSSNPMAGTDLGALVMSDMSYSVVGIALRTTTQPNSSNPGVGSLWGIASNSTTNFRLCTINPSSGVVTFVGGVLVMDDSAGVDAFGFGFDPSRDRFQFISVQNNYEIDPNTVSATKKTDITFPTSFPAQSGAAFTTASYGETSRFYNISRAASPRTLQTSANISSGSLTQINPGGLGADVDHPLGLAISGSLFLLANSNDVSLYSINRSTGTKTLIGAIGGGAPGFRGLAIVPASFPPVLSQEVKLTVTGKKRVITTKTTAIVKGTASCDFGVSSVKVKVGKTAFKTAAGTTSWKLKAKLKPGVNVVKVQAFGGNGESSSIVTIRIIRK